MTTQLSTYTPEVPELEITLADIVEILVLAKPRLERFDYPAHPLLFSCSSNGTWPTTNLGPVAPLERTMVDGQNVLLDIVSRLMMLNSSSRQGGRFTITLEGAFRTRDGSPIAMFALSA